MRRTPRQKTTPQSRVQQPRPIQPKPSPRSESPDIEIIEEKKAPPRPQVQTLRQKPGPRTIQVLGDNRGELQVLPGPRTVQVAGQGPRNVTHTPSPRGAQPPGCRPQQRAPPPQGARPPQGRPQSQRGPPTQANPEIMVIEGRRQVQIAQPDPKRGRGRPSNNVGRNTQGKFSSQDTAPPQPRKQRVQVFRQNRPKSSNPVDLMMECEDEELSPWQLDANKRAQEEYKEAQQEVKKAEKTAKETQKILEQQAIDAMEEEERKQMEAETARREANEAKAKLVVMEAQQKQAQEALKKAQELSNRPVPTSIQVVPPPPQFAFQQMINSAGQIITVRVPVRPTPQQNIPPPVSPANFAPQLPRPLVPPTPMQPSSQAQQIKSSPTQYIQPVPKVTYKPISSKASQPPPNVSQIPVQLVQPLKTRSRKTTPDVNLNDDVEVTYVSGTSGLGVKRSSFSAGLESPGTKRGKPSFNVDDKGLLVPLEEYYYGKKEGNPSYTEAKGEFRFKCYFCHKMLYNNMRMMLHVQGHIDAEKQQNLELSDLTQCKHCYRQFDTPFEMQIHIEKVHQNKDNVLVCRICEREHDNRKTLTNHMRVTHNCCEMPYICNLCSFRSSVYSDVIDHFKKRHDSSEYIMCLYCLKSFKIKFSSSNGWGLTQNYYNHLMKHLSKAGQKRCNACKLTYLNRAELQKHKSHDHQPNHRGIGVLSLVNSSKANSDQDIVMIKVPDKKQKPKSLNASAVTKVLDFSHMYWRKSVDILKCKECKQLMGTLNHFRKYVECSMCRFATICSNAYADHMITFHSGKTIKPGKIATDRKYKKMYCLCGFTSSYANKIANHLVLCSKRTCYSRKQQVRMIEYEDRVEPPPEPVTPVSKPKSIFDHLGLVKKPSELGSPTIEQPKSQPGPLSKKTSAVSRKSVSPPVNMVKDSKPVDKDETVEEEDFTDPNTGEMIPKELMGVRKWSTIKMKDKASKSSIFLGTEDTDAKDNDKDVTKDPMQDDAMDFEDSNDAGMADTVTDIISSLEDKNNEMEPHAINEKEETYINKIADNAASGIHEAEKGAIDNATESTDPIIDETVSEKDTIDIAIEPTGPIIDETLSEKQPEEIMDDDELSMKEHSNVKKATEDPSHTEELEDITKTSFENNEASSICNTIEENTNKPSDEQIYNVPSDELGVNALDDDTSDRNGSPNVEGSMEDDNDTPMFDLDNVDVIPTQIEDNKQTVDDSAEEKVLEMPKEIEADQIKDTIDTNEKEDNSANNQDIPDENASEQVQATEGEKQEKNTEQQDNIDNGDNIKVDEQDNVDNNEPGNVTNNQQDNIETNDSKEKTAIDNRNTNVDNGTDDLSQVDTHQSTNVPGIVGASELSTPNSLLQPDINIPFEDKHLNSPGTPVMDEPEDAEPIEDQITDTPNTLEQVTQLEPEDILEHDTPKGKETGFELEKEPDARKNHESTPAIDKTNGSLEEKTDTQGQESNINEGKDSEESNKSQIPPTPQEMKEKSTHKPIPVKWDDKQRDDRSLQSPESSNSKYQDNRDKPRDDYRKHSDGRDSYRDKSNHRDNSQGYRDRSRDRDHHGNHNSSNYHQGNYSSNRGYDQNNWNRQGGGRDRNHGNQHGYHGNQRGDWNRNHDNRDNRNRDYNNRQQYGGYNNRGNNRGGYHNRGGGYY